MVRIGVQGIKGSFSETAGITFAKNSRQNEYQLDYLVSSKGVLSALTNRTIDYGIIAIENNTGGIVLESIHALAQYQCQVTDIFSLPIKQNLLALNNTQVSQIQHIYSHRQALRQCSQYLKKHFPNAQLYESQDTADAARSLSESELPQGSAVIANAACAEIYGLNLLAENIQDNKENKTQFLALKAFEEYND